MIESRVSKFELRGTVNLHLHGTVYIYIYICTKISNMNLHIVGKLRCGITKLNTKLTHGTETENKGETLGVDYQKKLKGNKS